ncbi:V4R domain-containing protein [Pseudoduganella albidiflava]|uniref:4-vinyl reductase 4VR domain-containing protein n=1 Tax=Pseudoduganella albidiflava TaxID=321983 RepID=A0A411WVN2_9BURK|nr:V4R domain-containing protein [Pseudoduganella albidiflava]QBI00804.1 hypothetical protein EYF70_08045 [Pseudoduganella albidiflava]GGY30648.1 hypothetical protein GCM10007387_10420 [Pseudoduganella albidiflava]
MSAFWDRIGIDETAGTIFDGDRRYLMMRTDVLMGMLHELPAALRGQVLAALAESTRQHGGKSVRAYLEAGSSDGLARTVVEGAAAFGWGVWHFSAGAHEAGLEVENSPFAAGHGPSDVPVCAPIRGIFHSLAQSVLGSDVRVTETQCAAQHGGRCRFVARRAEPSATSLSQTPLSGTPLS